jgi:hypothetical protein
MADAPDSKSGPRKRVWVQVPPSVLAARGESHLSWRSDDQHRYHARVDVEALWPCCSNHRSLTETPPNSVLGTSRWPLRQAEPGERSCVSRKLRRRPRSVCCPRNAQIGMVSPERLCATRTRLSRRRADRLPAGGNRDTMSWVRGPVRDLIGGKAVPPAIVIASASDQRIAYSFTGIHGGHVGPFSRRLKKARPHSCSQ